MVSCNPISAPVIPTASTPKFFASVYQAAKESCMAMVINASAIKGERLAARFFKC